MGEAARRIARRRMARTMLSGIIESADRVTVIHYSCESFYDQPDGNSPRITSIAVLSLASRQTKSFSIHQVAERKKYSPSQLEIYYDELEKIMLKEFYEYVKSHSSNLWLHWNMRNINYGFEALSHRFRVLGGQAIEIHEAQLVDLSHVLIQIYGVQYIGHPRLPNLVDLNHISRKEFLTGAEEARAFEAREYVKLHQSTLRKADILATIAERAAEGRLKTRVNWKDTYRDYPEALGEFLRENWIITIIGFISALAGIIALFFAF
jgi:hypothetical protein